MCFAIYVPGLSKLWGDGAFMCPYCHGWEHRDQRIAILGGAGAAHRVALLRSWTSDLVVLADGEPTEDVGDVPVDERLVASVAPDSSASRTRRAGNRRAARRGADGAA